MTTAAAFIVALKSSLQTRFNADALFNGSSGAAVTVLLVEPADKSMNDHVVLVRDEMTGEQEYASIGRRRRDDEWRIPGFVQAYAADPSADVAFRAACDRASLILGEIEKQLRDSPPMVGDTLRSARVAEITLTPYVSPDKGGWFCRANFTTVHGARVA